MPTKSKFALRLISLSVSVGMALALASCQQRSDEGSKGQSKGLAPLDILIDWQAEPTYLGVYRAVQKGFLREAGFNAKVTQSWGANQSVAAIAAGKYKLGTASGGATVLGRNNGADVVSTAVLYPRIPTVVYGLASSGIKKPADLKGKKIGIYPGSITNNEFHAFLKLNGLRKDDVKIVSLSGADIPYLLSGKVDAVLHYTEMSPVQVEVNKEIPGKTGSKAFELHLADYGVEGYGLNIIANPSALAKDRKGLLAATSAIVKGYVDGCQHRKDAVDGFVSQFPDKDINYVRLSWDKVCNLIGPEPGHQDAQGWEKTIKLYQSLGLLKTAVSPEDIMD